MKVVVALAVLAGIAHAEPRTPGLSSRRLFFRAGGARMTAFSKSRELELVGVDGAASLALQDGPIAGSGAAVSAATIPLVIVGYTLPVADDRLAIETILGTPLTVKFAATGTLATQSIAPMALGIPTGVPALGTELGSARAIPPVLTLVWKLRGADRAVVPLIGAGASVLYAYGAKVTNPTLTAVGQPTMTLSPAFGFVIQGGLDVRLAKRIRARLDIKYIAGMVARARVDHLRVATPGLPLFDAVEVGAATMSVMVNPLIAQLAIGCDF